MGRGDPAALLTQHERNGFHKGTTQLVTGFDDATGAGRLEHTAEESENPSVMEEDARVVVIARRGRGTSDEAEATHGRIERRWEDQMGRTANQSASHLNV
ncbi:hypothetical protein AAHE18_14G066800 [Arachis hypogaea]